MLVQRTVKVQHCSAVWTHAVIVNHRGVAVRHRQPSRSERCGSLPVACANCYPPTEQPSVSDSRWREKHQRKRDHGQNATKRRPDVRVHIPNLVMASGITSVLSERPLKHANQKTERSKILNPEYNICRDQPTSRASPLRINTLLFAVLSDKAQAKIVAFTADSRHGKRSLSRVAAFESFAFVPQ